MKDATELHYGNCRTQLMLGTKSQDITDSALFFKKCLFRDMSECV